MVTSWPQYIGCKHTRYLMQRARVRILLCELARIDGRLFLGAGLPATENRGLLVVGAVRVVLFLLLRAIGAGAARGSVGRTAVG